MNDKVNEALHTLARVVPTRFSGEVAVVKAEIERLGNALQDIADIEDWDYGLEKAKDITFKAIGEPEGWSNGNDI